MTLVLSCFTQQAQATGYARVHAGRGQKKLRAGKPRKAKKMTIYGMGGTA